MALLQEAVKDLETVMQQRDSLAASLAEAKRAGGRAAKYAHALHAEVEKLRQRSSGEAADRIDAKHTVASLQAQVCFPSPGDLQSARLGYLSGSTLHNIPAIVRQQHRQLPGSQSSTSPACFEGFPDSSYS